MAARVRVRGAAEPPSASSADVVLCAAAVAAVGQPGTVPLAFATKPSLRRINLASNRLTQNIKAWADALPTDNNIQYLNLSSNALTGALAVPPDATPNLPLGAWKGCSLLPCSRQEGHGQRRARSCTPRFACMASIPSMPRNRPTHPPTHALAARPPCLPARAGTRGNLTRLFMFRTLMLLPDEAFGLLASTGGTGLPADRIQPGLDLSNNT